MVDTLQTGTPRPKSPAMNNEEPIELAHYPNAKKPNPSDVPTIERDDFPAPPVIISLIDITCAYTNNVFVKTHYSFPTLIHNDVNIIPMMNWIQSMVRMDLAILT